MGLLSADQAAELSAKMGAGIGASAPPSSAPEPSTSVSSEPSPDVKPAEKPETTQQVQQTTPTKDKSSSSSQDTGQKVPYGRFKNVVDARNRYRGQAERFKSDIASRDAQISELQSRMETASRTPVVAQPPQTATAPEPKAAETSWLDEILGVSESENADTKLEAKHVAEMQKAFDSRLQEQASSFESRMHEYEVTQAQRQLESEISTVRSRYPSLRAQDLAQLVVNDPSVDLMESAETFMTYKAALEEEAVAKYLRDNPQLTQAQKQAVVEAATTAAPVAPPRTSGARSSTSGEQVSEQKPRTLKDVKFALRDHFAKNNPFSR